MSLATATLPSDPEDLRAFARSLQLEMQREIAVRDAELHAKTLHIEKLKAQLAALKRARFGRSSEKIERAIEQLELTIGELEENQAQAAARATALGAEPAPSPAGRASSARRPLPEHLPRETVTHAPPERCPECGGTRFGVIGTDEREVLEYVPASFRVVRHARPKLSCRACETVVQAPMPSLPIERGRPGPALLAHVLVAKYGDHQPLHRQSEIYARGGVTIDRSVMAGWVGEMAAKLDPLVQAIGAHVLAGTTLHADDTPVPVLDPGRGKTKEGRLWAVVRDERPWGSADPPAVLYRYSPNRKGEHALALLGGCGGHLHADGYSGFNGLYAADAATGEPRLREVACWSHARRKLYEVHVGTGSAAAKQALDLIGALFDIEADIKGRSPPERLAARRQRTVPLLDELRALLDATLARISAKTALAGAIRYATSRWQALTRFAHDGQLEISNNAAERAIRPLALGRKNYLFAGSDVGGERAASIYTLIESAKINGLDPEAYLTDVIARIADHPAQRLGELLPWKWEPVQR
jgi:transposase